MAFRKPHRDFTLARAMVLLGLLVVSFGVFHSGAADRIADRSQTVAPSVMRTVDGDVCVTVITGETQSLRCQSPVRLTDL